MSLKGLKSLPILLCLKNVGPGETDLMSKIMRQKRGDRRNSAKDESNMSSDLLRNGSYGINLGIGNSGI
jgi:hypothetical protein